MTEYTISESLRSVDSPYMIALEEPKPYGVMIGEVLRAHGILLPGCRLCEVGGGYGSLMKGFLEAFSSFVKHVYMVDLSRFLLNRQKKMLREWSPRVSFVQADATEILPGLSNIDVIIINEVVGDLDTRKDLDANDLPPDVKRLVDTYGLEIPPTGKFNFNNGAILLVEEICRHGIPAFIAEHSSDPVIPRDMAYLERDLVMDGFPREIKLKGHSEFTTRFSHLIKVAEAKGRDVTGGSLIDLVGVKKSQKMQFIFNSRACATEEHEIIYELLDHIREYRWLMIN